MALEQATCLGKSCLEGIFCGIQDILHTVSGLGNAIGGFEIWYGEAPLDGLLSDQEGSNCNIQENFRTVSRSGNTSAVFENW